MPELGRGEAGDLFEAGGEMVGAGEAAGVGDLLDWQHGILQQALGPFDLPGAAIVAGRDAARLPKASPKVVMGDAELAGNVFPIGRRAQTFLDQRASLCVPAFVFARRPVPGGAAEGVWVMVPGY